MTTLRRAMTTFLVAALFMALTAVPALAALSATASITSGDILSGQGGAVSISIRNSGSSAALGGVVPADSSVNAIQIEVPTGIFAVDTVELPAGWNGGYDAEIGFVYATAADTAKLAPGATMVVKLNGAAVRIDDDSTRNMPVFVSDNGGTTLKSAGTPPLTSRILEVVSATVIKPAGATNGDLTQVTEQQNNVKVAVGVINHAASAKDVTVSVARASGSSTISSTPVTPTIAGNDTLVTTTIDVVFGAAGTLNLDATATSGSSSANALRLGTITVQPRFTGSYVVDSLNPTSVKQGSSPEFSLRVNKAGAQPAVLATTFAFPGYTNTTDVTFAAGTSNNLTITFPAKVVDETLPNGTFDSSLRLLGSDGNGALVDVSLVPNKITLDNLLPVITLNADVGSPAVTGAEPAAGNGRNITFTGTIKVGPETAAPNCTNCTITRSVLVTDTGAELALPLTNTNGNLSATRSFTFPAGTTSARAEITVKKVSGLLGNGQSNTFVVDIIAPTILEARTQRNAQNDSILVTMTELVNLTGSRASDWSVDNNLVTAVTPVGNAAATTQAVLTLGQRFASTNATPTVSYQRVPINGNVFDRVALTLLDQAKEAIDGIAPAAPVIAAVAGFGLQDGAFWTNDSTPTVGLTGLVAGDVITLTYDGATIFTGPANAASMTVQVTTDLGSVERSKPLSVSVTDGGSNTSPLATETLNLDYTAPKIVDFTVDAANGNRVTVVFDEPLPGGAGRGRDAAFDWTALALQNGESRYRTVESVEFSSSTTRVLNIAPSSYTPANGAVQGVRYTFRGAEVDRYEDRATNDLPNSLYNKP